MTASEELESIVSYDTILKDIACIKDLEVLFRAIDVYFSDEKLLEDFIIHKNACRIRSELGRKKVAWAIRGSVLKFENQEHRNLIRSIFTDNIPYQDMNFALLWQLSLNNRLFREITSNIFMKVLLSGRVSISPDDIIGYVKDRISEKSAEVSWSDETIYRIAVRYLSLMAKLGFVSSERVKSFLHIRPTREVQVLFLYFAKLYSPEDGDIFANPFLPFSFIPLEDLTERYKKLSMKGYFEMNFNGTNMNIELVHSYEQICNVLYN